jgi:hypothetical protein
MNNFFYVKTTTAVMAMIIALCMSCTEFPTQLGYIGEEYLQTVGFVFTPYAEGAPGDTVRLHAYFAGEPVSSYKCSLSTQYSMNMYGSDTAVNFREITGMNEIVAPESICFSFIIPPDFFQTNSSIFQLLLAAVPDSMKSMLPPNLSPAQVIEFARQFLTLTDFSTADSATRSAGARFAELLSGKMVLHLWANRGYVITRTFSVRYNTHVKGDPQVYVNHNPDPFWIGVYKVKNRTNLLFFSPARMDTSDTLICLFTKDTSAIAGPRLFTDTVLIDTGYSYYMAADSGIVTYQRNGSAVTDTLLDKAISFDGRPGYETYSYLWFCRADTVVSRGENPQNLMIIANGRGSYDPIASPLDTAIHRVDIWLRMSDSFLNGYNRPSATAVRQTGVVLMYSPAYAASAKKK